MLVFPSVFIKDMTARLYDLVQCLKHKLRMDEVHLKMTFIADWGLYDVNDRNVKALCYEIL